MDFLGVGPLEFLIIIVIALIVVGPERLPELARSIGKTWRQLYNMSRVVTAQWQEEFNAAAQVEGGQEGLRKALTEPLTAARADVERALAEPLTSIRADTERALTAPITTPVEIRQAPSSTSSPPAIVSLSSAADGQNAVPAANDAGAIDAAVVAVAEGAALPAAVADSPGDAIGAAAAEVSAPVGNVEPITPSSIILDGNSDHGKE